MNKNRIFALALAAAMTFALASCAEQTESTYVPPAGVAVQVEAVVRDKPSCKRTEFFIRRIAHFRHCV